MDTKGSASCDFTTAMLVILKHSPKVTVANAFTVLSGLFTAFSLIEYFISSSLSACLAGYKNVNSCLSEMAVSYDTAYFILFPVHHPGYK